MTDVPASDDPALDGITFLDHTADVGIDVVAPSLELLFHRAAVGMLALLLGLDDDEDADGPSSRSDSREPSRLEAARGGPDARGARGVEALSIELEADTVTELLADWLRELLFLHETRHAHYARATFDRLTEAVLEARVQTGPAAPAVREIKGVTYHELGVERTGDGWRGRVIFDV